jgi:hypothetical protein
MTILRAEGTVDFSRPASVCLYPQGGGEITFILITAGDRENATLTLFDGPSSDYPILGIPIKVSAGNSQNYQFPSGSLEFSNGLYGILRGEGSQARVMTLLAV